MKDQSFSTVDAATDEREDIIRLEAVVSVLFNPMVDCMKCKCKLIVSQFGVHLGEKETTK